MKVAKNYITILQKNENAPNVIIEVNDGYEEDSFYRIWFDTPEKYNSLNKSRFSEIGMENNWYKDVSYYYKISHYLILL